MLVFYTCSSCGNSIQKIYAGGASSIPMELDCGVCGGKLERKITAPTLSTFETVDDGTNPKKLEIRSDINTRRKEKGDKYLSEIQNRVRPFTNTKEEN